jgi:hypothetical protein
MRAKKSLPISYNKVCKRRTATESRPGKSGFCKENMMSQKADFRQFYRDAHAVPNLSEREKILMGLAVAFTRNCQP